MPKKTILDRLMDWAETSLRNIVESHPEHVEPAFLTMDAQGNGYILIQPGGFPTDSDKQAALRELSKMFQAKQVVAYAAVTECWMAKLLPGTEGSIRDRSDKKEVTVVSATDGMEKRLKVFHILRGAKGRIVGLEHDEHITSGLGGTLFDLLGGA